jgi:hypothetical protein
LSAVFSAHYYVSNAPASAWRCLHDGTGCAIYLLCSFSNVTGTKYVLATANNSSSTGAQITMVGAVNQYVAFKASGAATVVNPITVSVNATSTAYSIVAGYASANTPDADIQRSWSTEGSGNESTSPDAGDPAASLYFGNRPAVTAAFTGSLASMIIFNRARTTALDQIVRAYFAKRFRVTT